MKIYVSGCALPVICADDMRALEASAIGSGAVSGLDLMERAGAGVVRETLAAWPELAAGGYRACILCGPGNNGGDGYVIARLLAARGWGVSVVALGDTGKLPGDAKVNHDRWAAGHPVRPWTDAGTALDGADLVVDALFGIGLTRPLSDDVAGPFACIPAAARRVSVDVPSGTLADSRAVEPLNKTFPAQLAVTFHAPKPVHVPLAEAGLVVTAVDIGL